MRIALNGLFLDAPATGTGQYLTELVRALRDAAPEDEFTLIAPQVHSNAPTQVSLAPTRLRRENLAKLEFEHITFPRALGRGSYDAAHVPHFGPPLRSPIPLVVTIHDLIPLVLPAYRGSPRVRLYTRLAGIGARRAHAVIADSEASARDIQAHLGISRERMHVVYLAADARFAPVTDATELARVRARYELPECFILYFGGFDIRKNVPRLVEAYAQLAPALRTRYKFVLAGKLPEENTAFFPDVRAAAQRLGVLSDIVTPGFISEADKPALYSAARLFVYGSQYEGFGLPPLEAMACGTPVISSRAASLPEVIGDAGMLVEPDDVQGWVTALRALLEDELRRAQLREAGLERARLFSWERTARETLAVYRSVV